MLTRLHELPHGVDGFMATGTVTRDDYRHVMEPFLQEMRRADRRVRLLYEFSAAFEGFTADGLWEDARIGWHYLRLFERCAVVTDIDWIRRASLFARMLVPCPLRIFTRAERDNAVAWLSSPPALMHRLLEDRGVLILEPQSRLRTDDFDAVAMTVDPWIERHGQLNGVVIHVREFPGWDSLQSFLRHIRFVRDHHQHVRRVALAADGAAARLLPPAMDHFVEAEVRRFGYNDVEQAMAWASSATNR